MSNTNPWHSLSVGFTVSDDSFNAPTGGSKFLDVGKHAGVILEGIQPATSKNGNTYLQLVWANEEGQTSRDSVFLTSRPDKNGNIGPHFTFKRLLAALCPDHALRLQLGTAISANPQLFAALVGLRADIEISPPKSGWTLKEAATGGVYLWDIEKEAQIGTEIYDDYTLGKEAGENLDDLRRGYNNVSNVSATAIDNDNESAITAILSAGAKPAVKSVPVGTPRRSM